MADHNFRLRIEALPDDALIVVRGGLLEATTLRTDAAAARVRFGEYAISVFGAADEQALDLLAAERLNRFDVLTVTTVGAIRRVGLEILPTFRRPHYTILLPVLDIDVDWNEEDDTGLPWTLLERAAFPDRIVPGAYVVAGRGSAVAVAEVIDRDDAGVVHLRALPGPVSRHAHLLGDRAG